MTDNDVAAPAHETPAGSADGPLKSERMTGSELQIARLHVGMSRADLARVLSVGENTVRRWEIGKDPVPLRVRDEVRQIEMAADRAVKSLIESLREMPSRRVVVFREQGPVSGGPPGLAVYGPGWWREVAGRVAREVPEVRVGTTEEFDAMDREQVI